MENIKNNKIERLVLKEDDVLVIKIPFNLFKSDNLDSIRRHFKNQLHPRKNKIIIIPEFMELSIIGSKSVKEHISDIDLWNLFKEEEDQ